MKHLNFFLVLLFVSACGKDDHIPNALDARLVVDITDRHLTETLATDQSNIVASFGLEEDPLK